MVKTGQAGTNEKMKRGQENEPRTARIRCSFGVLRIGPAETQCEEDAVWQSTFKGKPCGLYWCNEHRPSSEWPHGEKRIQSVERDLARMRKPGEARR